MAYAFTFTVLLEFRLLRYLHSIIRVSDRIIAISFMRFPMHSANKGSWDRHRFAKAILIAGMRKCFRSVSGPIFNLSNLFLFSYLFWYRFYILSIPVFDLKDEEDLSIVSICVLFRQYWRGMHVSQLRISWRYKCIVLCPSDICQRPIVVECMMAICL